MALQVMWYDQCPRVLSSSALPKYCVQSESACTSLRIDDRILASLHVTNAFPQEKLIPCRIFAVLINLAPLFALPTIFLRS